MYEKIENIIARTLSSFEYESLEQLKNKYTENQIVDVYKKYGDKPIGYIQKVLSSKNKNIPNWLNQDIKNEKIDKETKKEFDEFNKFMEEFRK